jgi:hypothetical protein
VTDTLIVDPTSELATVYVDAVAPLIATPLLRHWNETVAADGVRAPAVSTDPTVGVPLIGAMAVTSVVMRAVAALVAEPL